MVVGAGAGGELGAQGEGEERHRRDRRGKDSDLDPAEDVIAAQPHAEREGDGADDPAESDEGVSAQGDHRLGEGEGDHVAGAAGGEDRQGHPVELGVVHLLQHERPDRECTEAADDSDADDEHEQPAQSTAELGEVARRGEPAEAGEQRRLHRLEHEQRDAGEQDAVAELGHHLLGLRRVLGQDVDEHWSGVEQRRGEDGAEQQPPEIRRDLLPRRFRPVGGRQLAL